MADSIKYKSEICGKELSFYCRCLMLQEDMGEVYKTLLEKGLKIGDLPVVDPDPRKLEKFSRKWRLLSKK